VPQWLKNVQPIADHYKKRKRGKKKTVYTQHQFCSNLDCDYYLITDDKIHALVGCGKHVLGDLSLNGYRSENWTQASSAIEAVEQWRGDEPHLKTMISINRSDIGDATQAVQSLLVSQ
jgi:hypothetical protein